jgi:hypothetical protein
MAAWRRLVLLTTSVIALSSASEVSANTASWLDPDDSAGRMDIGRYGHGHVNGRLVHWFRTYERWPERLLKSACTIEFRFDTNHDLLKFERIVVVKRAPSGELRGFLYTDDRKHFLGYVPARRPDAKTIKIKISRHELGESKRYRWSAFTSESRTVFHDDLTLLKRHVL